MIAAHSAYRYLTRPMKKFFTMSKREAINLAVLLTLVLAFRSTVAEPFVVPSSSMEPTILPGDRLLVLKTSYDLKFPFTDLVLHHFSSPKRGDIIVFKYPGDPSINYIKRLIGVPGDHLEIYDGSLKINGEVISTPVSDASQRWSYQEKLDTGKTYTVQRLPHNPEMSARVIDIPPKSYFFMGDNRDNSNDSRYWGFVSEDALKGKAEFIWLSLNWSDLLPTIRWERIGKGF